MKKNLIYGLSIVLVLIFFVGIGVTGYLIGKDQTKGNPTKAEKHSQTVSTQTPVFVSPTPITGDSGIETKPNTVSFARNGQSTYLRYKGNVYTEETDVNDSIKFTNESKVGKFEWYGLIDIPPDSKKGVAPEIFSFKISPDKKSFIFVTNWIPASNSDPKVFNYLHTYYYDYEKKGKVTEITDAINAAQKTNFPKVSEFSPDGKSVALVLYSCWNCGGHTPLTFLYNFDTKASKSFKVSYFKWKDAKNYEYKEYITEDCPDDQPMGPCFKDPGKLPLKTGIL